MKNKTVLVTGGASGIGREIAKSYAQSNATVIVADIQPTHEDFSFTYLHCDVSNPQSIEKLFASIQENFGKLDILINNAGISKFTPFEEMTIENWDRVINTNLRSVFLCSKAALPLLRKSKGSIVNIASTRALMSEADTEAYSASKGGIVALTHAMAVSLAKYSIQVNCISPGWIETSNYEYLKDSDHAQHPSGRVGKPGDIARACLYLTDEGNNFVNGTNLVIDGGMTVKMIYEE